MKISSLSVGLVIVFYNESSAEAEKRAFRPTWLIFGAKYWPGKPKKGET